MNKTLEELIEERKSLQRQLAELDDAIKLIDDEIDAPRKGAQVIGQKALMQSKFATKRRQNY